MLKEYVDLRGIDSNGVPGKSVEEARLHDLASSFMALMISEFVLVDDELLMQRKLKK